MPDNIINILEILTDRTDNMSNVINSRKLDLIYEQLRRAKTSEKLQIAINVLEIVQGKRTLIPRPHNSGDLLIISN